MENEKAAPESMEATRMRLRRPEYKEGDRERKAAEEYKEENDRQTKDWNQIGAQLTFTKTAQLYEIVKEKKTEDWKIQGMVWSKSYSR